MKILITGDFVINQSYSSSKISSEVKEFFNNADYNFVNLEAPVTDSNTKILKTGPHLKANKESTKEVLDTLKIDLVALANNHILDYDEQGVIDTLSFCQVNKIATVGAGKSKVEAAKIFFLDSKVGKIAFINIAENEWASATDVSAGANGMDLIDDVKNIQEASKHSDIVIVIVHGGHEYYNLPSPRMRKQYRFYIDNGADLVVGHHTHCISGMETYKNKPIYYSLGNFLFTNQSKYENWYIGMVLEVNISDDKKINTKTVFVEQSKQDFQLSLLKGAALNKITNLFNELSHVIQNENKLIRNWESYIVEKTNQFNNYWSPLSFVKNKWMKAILSIFGLNGSNKKGKALYLNLMRCEAHADLSKEVMEKYFNNK
jgi:hypothetical protein